LALLYTVSLRLTKLFKQTCSMVSNYVMYEICVCHIYTSFKWHKLSFISITFKKCNSRSLQLQPTDQQWLLHLPSQNNQIISSPKHVNSASLWFFLLNSDPRLSIHCVWWNSWGKSKYVNYSEIKLRQL